MGRPTEAQKAAKAKIDSQNGAEPVLLPPPEFVPEELNLIHQLLAQASFPAQAWEMARAADSAKLKIEAWAGTRPE